MPVVSANRSKITNLQIAKPIKLFNISALKLNTKSAQSSASESIRLESHFEPLSEVASAQLSPHNL